MSVNSMYSSLLDESPTITAPTKQEIDEAPSPFIPGTKIQFAFDSTSLGYFKTCPRLYQYIMIEGWVPKDESVHLRFGQEYHTALEQYDASRTNGVKHEDAIHDVIQELLLRTANYNPEPDTKAGKYKSRRNLIGLVIDYLDHFGEDDPAKTLIMENGKPATELTFKFDLGWGPTSINPPRLQAVDLPARDQILPGAVTYVSNYKELASDIYKPGQNYVLCGHLDRVVDFNGSIMVMDRKTTTTTLGPYYFRQYEPNNQMSLYTIAAKIVLNSPVKGVIIDAAQILLSESHRFVRGMTYRTPDQSEEWLTDLRVTLSMAEAFAQAEYWPMNDTSCDKFGGCRFRDVCSKSPGVRQTFLKADFNQLSEAERWNPLRAR